MKCKNKITKLVGGFSGDVRAYSAINDNAEVLQECCEHIEYLEKIVDMLTEKENEQNKEEAMKTHTNDESIWVYGILTLVYKDKAQKIYMDETDDPILFGDLLKMVDYDDKGTILLIAEEHLYGKIYRYGNYNDDKWYEVGEMKGFA